VEAGNVTMSGWIKIIVEFIKELAGQWKGSSDPNAPSETVDTTAEEEPVADSVVVLPESHQIDIIQIGDVGMWGRELHPVYWRPL
jgi:hypothetical protein